MQNSFVVQRPKTARLQGIEPPEVKASKPDRKKRQWPHRANAGSNPVERAGLRVAYRKYLFPLRRRPLHPESAVPALLNPLGQRQQGGTLQRGPFAGGRVIGSSRAVLSTRTPGSSVVSQLAIPRKSAVLLGPGVHAPVAQSVERPLRKWDAIGSIPVRGPKVRHGLIIRSRMSAESPGGQTRPDARQTSGGRLSLEARGSCELRDIKERV